MFYKKYLGKRGEELAAKYYSGRGYKVLAKNFWTKFGELDLVLAKNKQVLVVEVKTRTSRRFGGGEESVNSKKLRNIEKAYQIFYRQYHVSSFCKIEICLVEIIEGKINIQKFIL